MRRIHLSFVFAMFSMTLLAQSHFTPAFDGNGSDHMNINVITATINSYNLEAGDEIAVFDGSICCGVFVLTQSILITTPSSFAKIAASKADDGVSNGYTAGNTIIFKYWDSSAQKEYSGISAEFLDPSTGATIAAVPYTVSLTVFVKLSVSVINNAPTALAGIDQTVNEGTLTTLDGSASSDSDGDSITYLWTAPEGIILSSISDAKPSFIAPEVSFEVDYKFTLQTNDGFENSPVDEVIISVKNVNKAPVAIAGADQTAEENTLVTLDGSASFDADGTVPIYNWIAPEGITLSASSDEKPSFTAPNVDADSIIVFLLIVSDGELESNADTVHIAISNKTGIHQFATLNCKIYPNPTAGILTIETTELMDNAMVEVLTLNGKLMATYSYSELNHTLDLSQYVSGIYYLRIYNSDKMTYQKISYLKME
ncbi:MAG: PKD domain-containing protein [Prolixibacteraceae bacterium]